MTYNEKLACYWEMLPIGRENAIEYSQLCAMWQCDRRTARAILHDLACMDNGDEFILIRSSKGHGFYRTADAAEIKAYRKECLNRAANVAAAVAKCNRVLKGA